MVRIDIKVDDNGLANSFRKKGGEVSSQFSKFSKDLVDIAHRWVQNEAPRKTGRLKASIQKRTNSNGGYIFVSKAIANYCDFVIDGTRPHDIYPKHKKAIKTPYGIFKHVHHPGTKSNPFMDRGGDKMMGDINKRIRIFEKWLEEI